MRVAFKQRLCKPYTIQGVAVSSPLWEKCLSHLEGDLSAQQLNTWLRPLQAIETEDTLRLLAPNPYVKAWVHEQLEQQINTLIKGLSNGTISKIEIEVGTKEAISVEKTRLRDRKSTRLNSS